MAVVRDSRERWRYRKQIKLPDGKTRIRISGTPALNTKLEARHKGLGDVISPISVLGCSTQIEMSPFF